MTRFRSALIALLVTSLSPLIHAASVQGVVISTDGQAISGAVVRAYALESSAARRERLLSADPERKPVAEVTTDGKGKFTVDIKALPAAHIAVSAPGFAPSGATAASGDDLGIIALTSAPDARGRITAGGKPVAGALVLLSGSTEISARTDEKGEYRAPDPSKWASHLTVLHPDFARFEKMRAGQAKLGSDVTMTTGLAIKGRIFGPERTPIEGATVRVDGWLAGVSAADGTFTATHLPPDWNSITATKGDLLAVVTRTNSSDLTMTLRRGAFFSGTARDGLTRRELPAVVAWAETAGRFRASVWESVVTDEKGRFRIGPLPAAAYSLTANSPGYLGFSEELPIRAGEPIDRTLNLARAARIEGYVRDENRAAIAGAAVKTDFDPRRGMRWMSETAFSGPDGRFVVGGLDAPTSLELVASKKGLPEGRASGIAVAAGERKTEVVITIPRGVQVSVRVIDKEGLPIGGATVTAGEADEGSFNARQQVFFGLTGAEPDLPTTKKDGTAELRLKAGKYDFTAAAPGFAPNSARNVAVAERMPAVEITLSPGVEIRGRVVTSKGTPVTDASVSTMVDSDRRPAPVTTASDGAFVIADLPSGPVMIVVTKPAEMIRVQKMAEAPASDLVIETPATGRISGRVIDRATKRPVGDFQAGISGERGGGGMRMVTPPMIKSFHSDDGSFAIESVPVGKQTVVVTAPGYVRAEVPAVEVLDGKSVDDLEVALETGVRVVGKVTGPDGSPVAGVSVNARAEGERSPMPFGGGAQTDASGDYTIEAVESGEKTVTFQKEGFVTERKAAKLSGKEVRVDAQLSKGTEVTGVVVNESGAPVADAMVSARTAAQGGGWNEARTDAGGTFRMAGLAPGRYNFRAAKSGYPDKSVPDVDISANPNLRIVLEAGAVVYGTVTGFRPEDAKNVVVGAGSGNNWSEARIDSGGNYRIEGAPTGSVTVAASIQSMGAYSVSGEKRVDLAPGASVQVDLTFSDGSTVQGRVTRNGAPVSGVRVMFRAKDRRNSSQALGTSMDDGSYSVRGLQDGEYDLNATDLQTMQSFNVSCTVTGPSRCDVDMGGSAVRGTVMDSDTGEPIPGASVSVLPSATRFVSSTTTDARGSFTLDSLAPGTYQVRADKKGYGQQILDLNVTEGPAQDLSFRLSKTEGARLRVVDGRDGRDIGAMVAAIDPAGRVAYETFGGGADGVYNLPLTPGAYKLVIMATGLAPQNVRIVVPSAEMRVALSPGGRLVINSSSAQKESAKLLASTGEAYLRGRWDTTGTIILEPGRTTMENVAPGSYTLVVLDSAGNAKVTKQVTIAEGRTTEAGF